MMKTRLLLVFLAAAFAGACGGTVYSSREASQEDGAKENQTTETAPARPADVRHAPPPVETRPSADQPPRIQMGKAPISEPVVEPALPAPAIEPGKTLGPVAPAPIATDSSMSRPGVAEVARRSREDALRAIGNIRPEIIVRTTTDGEPVLQVRYPWHELPRPSVQIARVDETAESAMKPMALDGAAAEELTRKQIERLNKPLYPSSEELVKTSEDFIDRGHGELITLRGRENLLGKASAYAVDERTGTPVVVYLLDRWADEQKVLFFAVGDFDRTHKFDDPGKLRIWLLSEEQVVWTETVDWPGAKAQPPVAQQPSSAPQQAIALPQPTVTTPQDQAQTTAPGPSSSPTPAFPEMPNPPPLPKVSVPEQPVVAQPDSIPKGPETPVPPQMATDSSPGWKQAEPKTPHPPADPGQPPAQTKVAGSPGKPAYADMTVEQLARYIEDEFRSTMSPEVRRFWVNGYRYYFVVPNPPDVRHTIFADMLRAAYAEKPSPELAEALKALFQKLKPSQGKPQG